jgi:hypothetical protein
LNIQIRHFDQSQHVALAVDADDGTFLLGIPFDHGGSGHTRYFQISQSEFEAGIRDANSLRSLERNGMFLGKGALYWSDFVPDQEMFQS